MMRFAFALVVIVMLVSIETEVSRIAFVVDGIAATCRKATR